MKKAPQTPNWFISAAIVSLLGGCAITPQEVQQAYDTKSAAIATTKQKLNSQRAATSKYTVIRGNYLGSNLIPSNTGASLPERYRRDLVKQVSPNMGTLQQAVANIQSLGLGVRVNQDVTNPPIAMSTPTAATATAAPGVPVAPTPPKPVVLVPLSFSGDLTDYLNQITSQLGVSWEYNAANNEVNIYRLTTRTCTIMDLPGTIDFDDKLSGGGSNSTGASGTSVQGSSFGSSSNANVVAKPYDPWDSLVGALSIMVTPVGKLASNRATGTVFVTDTKEGVDRVCNLVATENAKMNLQVALEVHEVRVEVSNGNSIGADLSAVFQQLNAITGAPDWAFKFGSPTNLADPGSGSASFNIARPESRLSGSNIAVQALAQFGKIVLEKKDTIVTRNRVPGRNQDVKEEVYLASTTPASGSAVGGGGAGVPGLTPGTVTYGSTIAYVPTVGDNNQVVLHLFDTQSSLDTIKSQGSGSGVTAQQINLPKLSKRKFAQSFSVAHGETLIIVGSESDALSSNTNASATGASNNSKQTKSMSVLMVTPHVMQ